MNHIGESVENIQTPALLLDLDKFQWNIDNMFSFASKAGVNVRPHAKSFKAAAICNKVIEAGAIGLMTQKLGEAEVLLNSGVLYGEKNILISQEIADSKKIDRLVGLGVAMGEGKILSSIENDTQAKLLSESASNWGIKQHVIIEITHGRCGVNPYNPAVKLAKKVSKMKGLVFRGIYGYENPVEKNIADKRNKMTVETAKMIRNEGIEVEIVSAGSTGTYEVTGTYPGITEIEPGSFVFGVGEEGSGYGWGTHNDVHFKSSLSVLTQIIGGNFQDRVVTDAGSKVMSVGHCYAKPPVLAKVNDEIIECDRISLSEEHGTLRFKSGSLVRKNLKWGQKIEFIPNHCCTCVNQHDFIHVVKDDKLAAIWPITARGKYY